MIGHIAAGIKSTGIHTRIRALLADTGLGWWTFWIDGAFGSAAWWRSNEGGRTRAGSVSIQHLALGIGSAWVRLARILGHWRLVTAVNKRIARVALQATANRYVV